jgi:hypothetical protein
MKLATFYRGGRRSRVRSVSVLGGSGMPMAKEFIAGVHEACGRRTMNVLEENRMPGEASRPCIGCGVECSEGDLFHDEACFAAWTARNERRKTRAAS